MLGAVEQLRGVVQDDPQQALNIIKMANSESYGAPAMIVVDRNGYVSINNEVTRQYDDVGQLGMNSAECASMPAQMPPLSADDMNRAAKVSGDLRRGDDGALTGAAFQLAGLIKDDPLKAQAVIEKANSQSDGAPARIEQRGSEILIHNLVTGKIKLAGFLGGADADSEAWQAQGQQPGPGGLGNTCPPPYEQPPAPPSDASMAGPYPSYELPLAPLPLPYSSLPTPYPVYELPTYEPAPYVQQPEVLWRGGFRRSEEFGPVGINGRFRIEF
jgi:hypothetical protein